MPITHSSALPSYEERQARKQRDAVVFSGGILVELAIVWWLPSLPTLLSSVRWTLKAFLGVVAWTDVMALFGSVRLLWRVREYARSFRSRRALISVARQPA